MGEALVIGVFDYTGTADKNKSTEVLAQRRQMFSQVAGRLEHFRSPIDYGICVSKNTTTHKFSCAQQVQQAIEYTGLKYAGSMPLEVCDSNDALCASVVIVLNMNRASSPEYLTLPLLKYVNSEAQAQSSKHNLIRRDPLLDSDAGIDDHDLEGLTDINLVTKTADTDSKMATILNVKAMATAIKSFILRHRFPPLLHLTSELPHWLKRMQSLPQPLHVLLFVDSNKEDETNLVKTVAKSVVARS